MSAHVPFESDTTEVAELYPTFGGRLAFDIGANGGRVTRILAEHFQRVVALEPAYESFAVLAQDHPANVTTLRVAASRQVGEVTLDETKLTGALGELFTHNTEMRWGAVTGSRTVPATTLDTLSDLYGLPDFFKVDTEGHELEVLYGARTMFEDAAIKDHPMSFVIEVHHSRTGRHVQEFLDSYRHGYRLVRHERYRCESPLFDTHYWLVSEKENR